MAKKQVRCIILALAAAGHCTVVKAQAQPSSAEVSQYLVIMRKPIERYQQIMLNLLSSSSSQDSQEVEQKAITAKTEALALELTAVKSPAEVAAQQAELAKVLGPYKEFVTAGGTAKQGFHEALGLAKQMQAALSNYHDSLLAMFHTYGIPETKDPFISETASRKQLSTRTRAASRDRLSGGMSGGLLSSQGDGRDSGIRSDGGVSALSGPGQANSTGSSVSGLINGIAGTGLYGLADGVGFTEALNGKDNGAGSFCDMPGTSGMPGTLNDTSATSK